MDEERRIVPKRLLSFDAGQMSLSRLGKAFYNGPNSRNPSGSAEPKPESFDTNESCSLSFETKTPIACMAVNNENSMAALVSKEGIDLIEVEGAHASRVAALKFNNSLRLMPTEAIWQGKRHSMVHSEGSASAFFPPTSPSPFGPQISPSPASKLAVSDSNGTFRIYAFKGNSAGSSLCLEASSSSVGRAIRSLSFNSEQQNMLVTAVSDGSSRCWDLRQGLKRPVLTFSRAGDVTREVQFQPGSEHKFASIYDSGVVQRWDLRHRQAPDCRINAHQQGLSLDWHPTLNYLATGGRDHLIQVWDMTNSGGISASDLLGGGISPEYVIRVPNSVSRVSWLSEPGIPIWKSSLVTSGRPIESNNLKGTYSVWSLTRPHVPTYTIESHKDSITSIFGTGLNTVWSVGLDGNFFQTDLRFEPKVFDNFPLALVCMAPWDMAAVTFPCTKAPPVPSVPSSHSNSHSGLQSPSFSRRPSQLALLQTALISQSGSGTPQGLSIADTGGITNRRPINQRTNSLGLQRNLSTLALPTHGQSSNSARAGQLSSSPNSTTSSPPNALPVTQAESIPRFIAKSAPGFTIGSNPVSAPGSLTNSSPGAGPNFLTGADANSIANPRPVSESVSAPCSVPRSFSAVSLSNLQAASSPINLYAGNKNDTSAGLKLSALNSAIPVNPSTFWNEPEPADSFFDLKYIIEVGLPFENSQSLINTANSLKCSKEPDRSYGEVCRHNAQVMLQQSRFRYSEMWLQLGVAIDHLEAKFLRDLKSGNETDSEQHALAEAWFSGTVDESYEVRTDAVDDRTTGDEANSSMSDAALFEDAVSSTEHDGESLGETDWAGLSDYNHSSVGSSPIGTPRRISAHRWAGGHRFKQRFRSGGSSKSSLQRFRSSFASVIRPSLDNKDLFQMMKERFWQFVEEHDKPWDFFPMLRQSISESLLMGHYVSCVTLLLLFRAFPRLPEDFDTSGILLGGLTCLQQYSAFCPAAHIRKILREEVDKYADWFDPEIVLGPTNNPETGDTDAPDTICYMCLRSLSENAAFYARNDVAVGYWYCSKCKIPLGDCSLCDEPITGLCNVSIGCGHRIHLDCWNHWINVEKMQECPSGCGQRLTGL